MIWPLHTLISHHALLHTASRLTSLQFPVCAMLTFHSGHHAHSYFLLKLSSISLCLPNPFLI